MRALNQDPKLSSAILLAVVLGGYLYSSAAHAADNENIRKVNASVTVSSDERVGDVSTVNGQIDIDRGASAEEVSTVNGGIRLDDDSSIYSAETVNGGIRVGEDALIDGSLSTVNGGIRVARGSQVRGKVRSVNGDIDLRRTHVGENLVTSNGDISLLDGSVVDGDLVMSEKRRWWNNIFNRRGNRPELRIDATSSVRGDIHLYREVDLYIDPSAEVGKIIEHF